MSCKLTVFQRSRLLSSQTSRQNKLWIAATLKAQGKALYWRWAGEPRRSRLQFLFDANGSWYTAKSFDEDVLPLYKWDTK
jgi:hypothetical protein